MRNTTNTTNTTEGVTIRSLIASTSKSEMTVRRAMKRLGITTTVRPSQAVVSAADARRIIADFQARRTRRKPSL